MKRASWSLRLCLAMLAAGAISPAKASIVLGSPSCIEYRSALADPARKLESTSYQSWLLGYLSGLARGSELIAREFDKERFHGEYNVLLGESGERLAATTQEYCQRHPDKKLHEAAMVVFEQLLNVRASELLDSPAP